MSGVVKQFNRLGDFVKQSRQHIDHTCLKTFPDPDEPRLETPRKGTILRQLTNFHLASMVSPCTRVLSRI